MSARSRRRDVVIDGMLDALLVGVVLWYALIACYLRDPLWLVTWLG